MMQAACGATALQVRHNFNCLYEISMQPDQIVAAVETAVARLHPYIRETPLEYSPALSVMTGNRVFLKLENVQHTGSFKYRGAMHKLLALPEAERKRGVITASSGNHGMAVARAAQQLDMPATVYVAATASPAKLQRIRAFGAELEQSSASGIDAELRARAAAERQQLAYISPYNDAEVIAGQGTIGLEIARQLGHCDAVYVAVGGGGLISGVAGYLKGQNAKVEIIGCQPKNSAVMAASVAAGRVIDIPELPTLSDGTAGGIEAEAITLALCQRLVDRFCLVAEQEIAGAMQHMLYQENWLVEGSAGVAVAAALQDAQRLRGADVAVILCGRNLDESTIRRVLCA